MPKNYYEALGVDRDATPEQIKKAYRKLARKYHPDVSKENDAEAKMQEINVAYDTLSHTEKKAEYDYQLDHPQGQHQHYSQDQQGFSGFEDLFGRFGAGFGGARHQTPAYKGEDQHASIEVPIQVAYQGSTQHITLQIPTYNAYGEPEVQRKTLEIKIPKGLKAGQQIRLTKQGQAGINGGENGDLYIEVHYQNTTNVTVEDTDVFLTTNISPWEAVLGGTIQVQTPAGTLQINLPKNAKTGQKLRLKDKGIPAKTAGQLYLILNVVLPDVQNQQDQHAFEQLAQHFKHFNPRG